MACSVARRRSRRIEDREPELGLELGKGKRMISLEEL